MARKKRLKQAQAVAPIEEKPKEPIAYQDPFQEKFNKGIEQVGKQFEGKGRNILYGIAAVAVLALIIGLFYMWSRRSNAGAQAALGKAIETSQTQVSAEPVPAGFTGKVFKTEKERVDASIAEFQLVAENYGSPYREKAKYFIAVTKLTVDRQAAIDELSALASTSGEVGALSKFALAQAKQGDDKLDEAATLYSELAATSDPIISKDTINFALASIYEKQGKRAEAAEIYFKIADAASKMKDLDGKAVPLSQTANDAKERLQALDPAKAAEIKVEIPELPGKL